MTAACGAGAAAKYGEFRLSLLAKFDSRFGPLLEARLPTFRAVIERLGDKPASTERDFRGKLAASLPRSLWIRALSVAFLVAWLFSE